MANAKPKEIPNFIKAGSAKALRSLIIKNNIRLRATVQYFDFSHDGKNWYVWYYEPFDKTDEYRIMHDNTEVVTR